MAPALNKDTTGDGQTDHYTWLWPLQSSNGVFVFYAIFLNGANGTMYSPDFMSVAFNSSEGLDAMQAVYDALVTYEVMDPAGWGIGTNEEAHIVYAQGLCAMQVDPGRYHGLYNEDEEKSKIVRAHAARSGSRHQPSERVQRRQHWLRNQQILREQGGRARIPEVLLQLGGPA